MPSEEGLYTKQSDGTWAQNTQLSSSNAKTVQTQNGATVPPNSYVIGTWTDSNGYRSVVFTLLNDALTTNSLNVHWSHDQITSALDEAVLTASTLKSRGVVVETRARYFRVIPNNGDAVPHVMSVWAYLKV